MRRLALSTATAVSSRSGFFAHGVQRHHDCKTSRRSVLRSDNLSISTRVKSEASEEADWLLAVSATELLFEAFVSPDSSFAADSVTYDPSGGNQFLVNAAGVGYVLLVAYFLFRVLTRRAKRFREQKIADSPSLFGGADSKDVPGEAAKSVAQKKLTVMDGLVGALQSGVLTAGLFFFTTKVDALLLSTPLPDQYTAHNISVTVRTIIRGFCYLFTFVFGMNCIGLTGLTLKLMVDPDSVNNDPRTRPKETKPKLPTISVVSDPEEVARVFDEVSKLDSDKDLS